MAKRISGFERKRLKRLRNQAFEKQSHLCWWCDVVMTLPQTGDSRFNTMCTGEHLIPLEFGGTTSVGNVVAACARCNNGKRNYEVLQLDP